MNFYKNSKWVRSCYDNFFNKKKILQLIKKTLTICDVDIVKIEE